MKNCWFGHLEKTTLCPQVFPGLALFTYHFWVAFPASKTEGFHPPKTELQTVAAKSKPSPGKFQTFSRHGKQKWRFRWQIAGFTVHFSDFTFNDFCHTAFLKTCYTEG